MNRKQSSLAKLNEKGLGLPAFGLGVNWQGISSPVSSSQQPLVKSGNPLKDITNARSKSLQSTNCTFNEEEISKTSNKVDDGKWEDEFWSILDADLKNYLICSDEECSIGEIVEDSENEEDFTSDTSNINIKEKLKSGLGKNFKISTKKGPGVIKEVNSLNSEDFCLTGEMTEKDSSGNSKKKLISDFFENSVVSETGKENSIKLGKRKMGENVTLILKGGKATLKRLRKKRNTTLSLRTKFPSNGVNVWEVIPGTSFRVDGFKNPTSECSHWFLTHFHTDHYQGLTKNFLYGKVYCSMITARLLRLKIGLPEEAIVALPVGSTIEIEGVKVTFLDANHCPGAVMVLFVPPNGEVVLHTGDFRWSPQVEKDMAEILGDLMVHTLILDTTFCDPKFKFPSQEKVIQYVIDVIAAESFNPKTLFLIGTYVLGKEKIFLTVAKTLKRKVFVDGQKLKVLECLGLEKDDFEWITTEESESSIHAVPLWSIANFKRMASSCRHFEDHYETIVAFSPSGWSFSQGKKSKTGKRKSKGSLVRYEVPYSEHCNFDELCDFVDFIDPEVVIPSVNNTSEDEANLMVQRLVSGREAREDVL